MDTSDTSTPVPTPASPPLRLTAEQTSAVDKAMDYIRSEPLSHGGKPYFVIAGYAGTGKTTIINELVSEIERASMVPTVLTPTGKAASVLQSKGVKARTIHSFCYSFTGDDEQGKPTFSFDGFSRAKRVVLIDEASMVDEKILGDLLSTQTILILVGDQGQLPPVSRDPKILKDADVTLKTIHRQALESPILRFAHLVREGHPVTHAAQQNIDCYPTFQVAMDRFAYMGIPDPMVIVGTNGYRHRVNEMAHDPSSETEKICILRNAPQHNLFNGQVMTVRVLNRDELGNPARIELESGRRIFCSGEGWGATNLAGIDLSREEVLCDYGYAVTAHKAQGSEWDNVLVVEDWVPKDSETRWRYTAATRAKKNLIWARG